MISTRRLSARPAALALSATGVDSPLPVARRRLPATPASSSTRRTASARRCDSARLASSAPWLSVWPSIVILPPPESSPASARRLAWASAVRLALPLPKALPASV